MLKTKSRLILFAFITVLSFLQTVYLLVANIWLLPLCPHSTPYMNLAGYRLGEIK